jgi:hypothetical protein
MRHRFSPFPVLTFRQSSRCRRCGKTRLECDDPNDDYLMSPCVSNWAYVVAALVLLTRGAK